jgi:hypothetical protein
MPTVSQPKNLGDLLKYEVPNLYSRDQDTVAAAQNLSLGTVVGRETATAKLKVLDPSTSDGTETAVGVLGNDVDATLIDHEDAILIARHAIVARGALVMPQWRIRKLQVAIVACGALVWPTGISTAHKVAAIKQLAERGVLARETA